MTKPVRTALLLFALALVVRLAVGAWTGFSREPVEDERGYVELATQLPEGKFKLKRPRLIARDASGVELFSISPSCKSFRAPVAPVLLAPVAALGGGVAAMRVLEACLGALGAPLLYAALRRTTLAERAWWPAMAYALWPPAIYESIRVLSEAPSQALLLGAVALIVLPRTRPTVGSGVLAALSVLARPAALLPAAFLVFATGSRQRGFAFLLAFLATLAPWMGWNWYRLGRPLLTTSTGVTLVGGNNQLALGAEHPGKWVQPEVAYSHAPDPPDMGMWGWSRLSEEASDRRFAEDALRWVGENPGDAATLCFWKLVRLFDPDPHSEKGDAGMKAIVGWLTTAPVLVLAAIGATRADRRWWLLLLGTVLTALIFYGDTRMRTCADPALLVMATYGLLRLMGREPVPSV